MSGEAVNFDYLEGFAAGDMQVVTEVLVVFREQAEIWRARLENPAEWREVCHTIKGAARGIGANRLGDICDKGEFADPSLKPQVLAEMSDALAAIEGYLTRIGGG